MNFPFKNPGPNARIDWPKAVVWFNEAAGSKFKNEEDLLRALHKLFPVKFIAEIFDVTAPTIEARLKWHGIGYTFAWKDSNPNKKQYSLDSNRGGE
jgi:hypothetical protein